VASSSALALFSGGQDSTVCLAWALERFEHVETVGFTYGQRHIVEIEQRAVILSKIAAFDEVGRRLGPDTVLDLAALQSVSDTALTREAEITFAATGLRATCCFLPMQPRSPTGAVSTPSSAACARRISRATPTVATIPCRHLPRRCLLGSTGQ
jgi:hypothetical protein